MTPTALETLRTQAERKLASGCETCVMPTREVLGIVNALRAAMEGLEYYANRMDSGGTARRCLRDIGAEEGQDA